MVFREPGIHLIRISLPIKGFDRNRHEEGPDGTLMLTADEIKDLRDALPEFKAGDRKTQPQVIKQSYASLVEAWKKAKGPALDKRDTRKLKRSVKEWFYNQGRKMKKKEDFRLTNKWTWRRVHGEEHKQELREKTEEQTGVKAGSREYLGNLKRISAEVQAELSPNEIDRLMEIADQWNSEGPPVASQQKMAEEKAIKLTKQFIQAMWKQCGTVVVAMGAFKRLDGRMDTWVVDEFLETGKVAFTDPMKKKEEKISLKHFMQWAQDEVFGDTEEGEGKPVPKLEVMVDDDGIPVLPDFDSDAPPPNLQMKAIIWDFITKHYRCFTHNPKASVPWTELKSNPNHFLDPEYYPDSFEFNDLSHIRQKSSEELLAHWSHQRDDDQVVFEFSRCKEGDMRDPSLTKGSRLKPQVTKKKIKTRQKLSSKAKGKRRARVDSETEAEDSDTELDSSTWSMSSSDGLRGDSTNESDVEGSARGARQISGKAGPPARSNSEMVDTNIAVEAPKSSRDAGEHLPEIAGSPGSRHETGGDDREKAKSPPSQKAESLLVLEQSNSAAQSMVPQGDKIEEIPLGGGEAPARSTNISPKVTRSRTAKSDLKTDQEQQGSKPAKEPTARPSQSKQTKKRAGEQLAEPPAKRVPHSTKAGESKEKKPQRSAKSGESNEKKSTHGKNKVSAAARNQGKSLVKS
ncbi:hypothetical protein JAAARDRAFT_197858 [Jaapia argillacea MUCL 33604]|uniref:Uncharacterized protein n=1 Tax=Jaapia argillacea MUCL 33604 TaxID=933084 RepID=A0A067PGX3_9AGAM|nr:hypothetical protein JAAARDRAFT_197858 [Jaapia argillacea MUCL 33604]